MMIGRRYLVLLALLAGSCGQAGDDVMPKTVDGTQSLRSAPSSTSLAETTTPAVSTTIQLPVTSGAAPTTAARPVPGAIGTKTLHADGIGRALLGMTYEEALPILVSTFGAPTRQGESVCGIGLAFADLEIWFAIPDPKVPTQLVFETYYSHSRDLLSDRAVHVGSTRTEVLAAYPEIRIDPLASPPVVMEYRGTPSSIGRMEFWFFPGPTDAVTDVDGVIKHITTCGE